MSVTVSTSLDGVTPPAAVPDLQTAIQAAYAFAAQAQAAMVAAQAIEAAVAQQLALAQSLINQANGILQLAIQKQAGFSAAGLAAVLQGLQTTPPTSTGVLWLDGNLLAIS